MAYGGSTITAEPIAFATRSPLPDATETKMASMKILTRVLTDEVDGGYRITMETDDGQILHIFATENQISDLADELDEMLDEDDSDLTDEEEHVGEEQPS